MRFLETFLWVVSFLGLFGAVVFTGMLSIAGFGSGHPVLGVFFFVLMCLVISVIACLTE